MDRISVNIISPKLSKKGRQSEIYMYVSFGLVFLLYPINLLTGESVLYKSVAAIFIINVLFSAAYYYFFVDRYAAIGQIIFFRDEITVDDKTGINNYRLAEITRMTISYQGYTDQPYSTSVRPYIHNSSGHDNMLSFQLSDKSFEYRFAIPNKAVMIFLSRQFDNYKNLGADIRLIGKQAFVEF